MVIFFVHILDAVTIRKLRTFSHLDPDVISAGLSHTMRKPSVGIAQKIDFGGLPCESWVENWLSSDNAFIKHR